MRPQLPLDALTSIPAPPTTAQQPQYHHPTHQTSHLRPNPPTYSHPSLPTPPPPTMSGERIDISQQPDDGDIDESLSTGVGSQLCVTNIGSRMKIPMKRYLREVFHFELTDWSQWGRHSL
ncbi:hypothetical protein P7C70_g8072, partial [Phenoliferia sp. Uapishka_3]